MNRHKEGQIPYRASQLIKAKIPAGYSTRGLRGETCLKIKIQSFNLSTPI